MDEKYVNEGDRVLIIDDFMASGEASAALAKIVEEAGGEIVGIGAVIEKGFQERPDRAVVHRAVVLVAAAEQVAAGQRGV
ncbi:MAG: phosphoribosyltransferase family protein, partial [Bacillota bacterium]